MYYNHCLYLQNCEQQSGDDDASYGVCIQSGVHYNKLEHQMLVTWFCQLKSWAIYFPAEGITAPNFSLNQCKLDEFVALFISIKFHEISSGDIYVSSHMSMHMAELQIKWKDV